MREKEQKSESSPATPADLVTYISSHAIERWMERTGCKSERQAHAALKQHLAQAIEVELAPQYKVVALLNHDLKPARYFKLNQWIFVISPEGSLVTIHTGAAKRWLPLGTKPPKKRHKRRPPR